jgi:hypothetical protein
MKRNIVVAILIMHMGTIGLGGQTPIDEKLKFFVAPREESLSVIAYQPDCPLIFKEAASYYHIGGGGLPKYMVRNRTSKTITGFTIRVIDIVGMGEYSVSFDGKDSKGWIKPGKYWPESKVPATAKVIPLTDQLRNEHNIGSTMRAVVVFMVERVEFKDGTVYNDEAVFKSLMELKEKIEIKTSSKNNTK